MSSPKYSRVFNRLDKGNSNWNVNGRTRGLAWEGVAPAEPRARGHVDLRLRFGWSLALPWDANRHFLC